MTSDSARWVCVAALAAAGWLVLANVLRTDWQTNPQYNYGWGMLPLAGYLLIRRWSDRPAAAPTRRGRAGVALVAALLLGLLLPIRLFQESNPDWRLVQWAHALTVTTLLLGGWWWLGGRAWLRHFWLPTAFLLLGVPWPSGLEKLLTDSLMRGVASVTVESLNFLGVLARQRGNLIELPTGIVGINEACSGVRSFQSTLMMAVFLGEYHRFRAGHRVTLVLGGVALALVFNVARSFTVTMVCVKQGTAAANAWHDPAGYAVFALAFAGLLALAAWLQRREPAAKADAAPGPAPAPPAPPSWGALATAGAWLLAVEVGTELWYVAHERGARRNAGWTLAWPREAAGYATQELDEVVQRTLRFSEGTAARWERADQTAWLGFFFRWEPGRASALLARNHTPDICMPASGLQLQADHGITPVEVAGLRIPFRGYTFTLGPRTLYMFYCVWEDQAPTESGMGRGEGLTPARRARAVLAGRRNLGQQVLQVAVAGPRDYAAARERFALELESLLRATPDGPRAGAAGGAFAIAAAPTAGDSPAASWTATH
jgi:exosortase